MCWTARKGKSHETVLHHPGSIDSCASSLSLLLSAELDCIQKHIWSVDHMPSGIGWRVRHSLCSFNCFGISAVYRLSFSLLLLYVLLALIMLCRNRCSRVVNEGLFFVKYILVVGAFIGFLWVVNDVFLGYGQACKYIGLLFLVLQVRIALCRALF